MKGINKVILIGYVGQAPNIINTQGGNKMATASLATTDTYKDKQGERKDITEWHKLVFMMPKMAEYVENNVSKGDRLYIEGSLRTRKWQDKAGKDNYTTEVLVSLIQNLTSKARDVEDESEDIPF